MKLLTKIQDFLINTPLSVLMAIIFLITFYVALLIAVPSFIIGLTVFGAIVWCGLVVIFHYFGKD